MGRAVSSYPRTLLCMAICERASSSSELLPTPCQFLLAAPLLLELIGAVLLDFGGEERCLDEMPFVLGGLIEAA